MSSFQVPILTQSFEPKPILEYICYLRPYWFSCGRKLWIFLSPGWGSPHLPEQIVHFSWL